MNPSTEFEAFVREMGLLPRRPVAPDGKWHRCPTESHPKRRNGAWKLDPTGRIGWVQDWASMESPATWRPDKADVPEFDPDALRRARAEQREKRQKAIRAAREFYDRADYLSGSHPYLDAKELSVEGCQDVRVDADGWLVIPAMKAGKVVSVQRIAPDGQKLFWKGAPVSGTAFVVARRGATVNVLCEGFATGLACYQAVRNARVWVLWNTGNLKKPPDLPPGLTVIAADNDHGTEATKGFNPGIEAGMAAAEEIGCGIAFPEWIQGTDWADYRLERVEEAMEKRGKYQTESQVRREVDAKIQRELMRNAVFVGPGTP